MDDVNQPIASQKIESSGDKRATQLHRIDSQSMALYVTLMILTVLTAWIFKHRRFRFIHETGLTLLYGAAVGFIIWMTEHPSDTLYSVWVEPMIGSKINWTIGPPQYLKLNSSTNLTKEKTFIYEVTDIASEVPLEQMSAFSPEIFFNILLPPIIFNAGYQMKKKQFFRNFGTIIAYAVLGTLISAFFIGYLMYFLCMWTINSISFNIRETLFFGSLISATDPVTVLSIFHDLNVERDLYALVMGESCLNDAVAIVLSDTVQDFMPSGNDVAEHETTFHELIDAVGKFFGVFFGSLSLGVLVGVVTALFTKFTKIKEQPLMETCLFILMSYLSFLVAEATGMTGIVAILFCGMTQAHYTFNNLSEESQGRTKELFEAVNFLAESFIFMYIGVSLFTSHATIFNFLFVLYSFVAIILARMFFVYTLTFIINLWRKPRVPMNYQHMIVWAGLRGAVAYALALRNNSTEQRKYIYTATSIIVAVTVLFNGGLTKFIIDKLKIKYGEQVDAEPHNNHENRLDDEDDQQMMHISNGHENIDAQTPTTYHRYNPWDKSMVARKWYNFDTNFMKPLLTHHRPSLIETMPKFLQPVANVFTTTEQITSHFDDSAIDDNAIHISTPTSPPILYQSPQQSTARII